MFLLYPQLPAFSPSSLPPSSLTVFVLRRHSGVLLTLQIRLAAWSVSVSPAAACLPKLRLVLGVTIHLYTRLSGPLYLPHVEIGTAYFRDSYYQYLGSLIISALEREGKKDVNAHSIIVFGV